MCVISEQNSCNASQVAMDVSQHSRKGHVFGLLSCSSNERVKAADRLRQSERFFAYLVSLFSTQPNVLKAFMM